mmetsp:Transcript_22385/g.44396  ORF Transcript_22385/g.44396 Transcript_22385/m.44396 type:complete len:156 (+) Transcript_22385:193-660(+)
MSMTMSCLPSALPRQPCPSFDSSSPSGPTAGITSSLSWSLAWQQNAGKNNPLMPIFGGAGALRAKDFCLSHHDVRLRHVDRLRLVQRQTVSQKLPELVGRKLGGHQTAERRSAHPLSLVGFWLLLQHFAVTTAVTHLVRLKQLLDREVYLVVERL